MGVFAGTERQCTEDEHDDEDENDSQTSEFGLNRPRSLLELLWGRSRKRLPSTPTRPTTVFQQNVLTGKDALSLHRSQNL
jgi:hypothetical protein